jgi:hypothetical protein
MDLYPWSTLVQEITCPTTKKRRAAEVGDAEKICDFPLRLHVKTQSLTIKSPNTFSSKRNGRVKNFKAFNLKTK